MSKSNIPHKALTSETEDTGTIYLYGYIGEDNSWSYDEAKKQESITDKEVLKSLNAFERAGKKRVNFRINSPGGRTSDGDAIINMIQSSKMDIHTYCDGTAASIAGDILLAAKKENRHMANNAKLMVHSTSITVYGNAEKLRETADMLDTFNNAAIKQMAADTGMSEDEVRKKYYDGRDHWFSSDDAAKIGFINKVEDYEAENVIAEPEKLSYQELMQKFHQPTEKQMEGWFTKMYNRYIVKSATEKQPIQKSTKSTQDMTIEELKASIADGTLKIDDVVKTVEANNYKVEKVTPPAPAGALTLDAVTKAMQAAVKPIQDDLDAMKTENAALKAQITKLQDAPGAEGPSGVPSAGDRHEPLTEAQKAFRSSLVEHAELAEKKGNPFSS